MIFFAFANILYIFVVKYTTCKWLYVKVEETNYRWLILVSIQRSCNLYKYPRILRLTYNNYFLQICPFFKKLFLFCITILVIGLSHRPLRRCTIAFSAILLCFCSSPARQRIQACSTSSDLPPFPMFLNNRCQGITSFYYSNNCTIGSYSNDQ